jgi:hypothetical protein
MAFKKSDLFCFPFCFRFYDTCVFKFVEQSAGNFELGIRSEIVKIRIANDLLQVGRWILRNLRGHYEFAYRVNFF